jgi:YegS/Rv2252/BmrU family lipid kinase
VIDVRSRRGAAAFVEARSRLEDRGFSVESATAVDDHALLLPAIEDAVASGVPAVVVGGGDGTLRSVVGSFAHRETALCVLPLGTANNFARSLAIPNDLTGAIGVLAGARVCAVDLGRLDGDVFANVVSLGFSPDVVRATPSPMKRRLGSAAYMLYETRYLVSQTLFAVTVRTPTSTESFRTRQMIVANGSHYGTRPLAPNARVDDGLLDIVAIDSVSRWQGLRFWLRYPLGRHLVMRGLRRIRCERAAIRTDPPLRAIVGGELGPETPFEVAVDPGALAVAVPPSFVEFRPGPNPG